MTGGSISILRWSLEQRSDWFMGYVWVNGVDGLGKDWEFMGMGNMKQYFSFRI